MIRWDRQYIANKMRIYSSRDYLNMDSWHLNRMNKMKIS